MPRRNLSHRQMRHVLTDLSGKRIVVDKAIKVAEGEYLLPGVDITEVAKEWPTLATHIKRGFLRIIDADKPLLKKDVLVEAVVESVVEQVKEEIAEADPLEVLRSLKAIASKKDLRAALIAAGVEVDEDASRETLFKLRSQALGLD